MTNPARKNWQCRVGLHDFPSDEKARFPGDCLPCYRDCGKAVQVGYDGMEVTHNVVPIIAARDGGRNEP